MELQEKKHNQIKGRENIPESSCTRKETVDIGILVTSRNGDRNTMHSVRITSRPPSRKRKWHQLSQFRCTSTKVITIEKIKAGYILTIESWIQERHQVRSYISAFVATTSSVT